MTPLEFKQLIREEIQPFREEMDRRFDAVDKRFEKNDGEFKIICHNFNEMDGKIATLSEQMAQFRDEVLTREDTTIRELRALREKKDFLGNRVTRVEERATALEVRSAPAAA